MSNQALLGLQLLANEYEERCPAPPGTHVFRFTRAPREDGPDGSTDTFILNTTPLFNNVPVGSSAGYGVNRANIMGERPTSTVAILLFILVHHFS